MNKNLMLIVILLVLLPVVSAFYDYDDYSSQVWDETKYVNVSTYGNVNMSRDGAELVFYGDSTGNNARGPGFKTINHIDSTSNGSVSFSMKQLNYTTNSVFDIWLNNLKADGVGLHFYGDPPEIAFVRPGVGLTQCLPKIPYDSDYHTIRIDVNHTTNNTGNITEYELYYDGVYKCKTGEAGWRDIYFNMTDTSSNTYHEYRFDNLLWQDNDPINLQCPDKQGHYSYENFPYSFDINSCHWSVFPYGLAYPTSGQLCYNATATAKEFKYDLWGQGSNSGSAAFREDFDLIVYNGTTLQKTFAYFDLEGGTKRIAYTLDFFTIATQGYIQYYYMDNGTLALNSLCANCFTPGVSTHYMIQLFGPDAVGYTAYNSTSLSFQPIQKETILLNINNQSVSYFNIPILQNSTDGSNIPEDTTYIVGGGKFCLDNYVLDSATTAANMTGANITNATLQYGDPCFSSDQCLTGLCENQACARKQANSQCFYGFECVSRLCVGGYCKAPTLWQNIDQGKTDYFGSDSNTNNLFALAVAVVLGCVLGLAIHWSIGAAGFVVGLFFFTIVGWLSPFILVGLVIVLALAIALLIVIGTSGG